MTTYEDVEKNVSSFKINLNNSKTNLIMEFVTIIEHQHAEMIAFNIKNTTTEWYSYTVIVGSGSGKWAVADQINCPPESITCSMYYHRLVRLQLTCLMDSPSIVIVGTENAKTKATGP
jgi:hypothetical protein